MESQVADGQDYYQLLGVTQDSGTDDIRKAYRRLARQYHPDVNGGDEAATERFREINRAYEVLSDPEKRARYDRFGAAGVDPNNAPPGGDAGFGSFNDIFDVLFGAGGGVGGRAATGQPGVERGADLRYDLEISLEEVLSGVKRTISVTRMETCEECTGSGARPGTKPQSCVACSGSGYQRASRNTIFGTMSQVTECYRCHGRGQIITDPCTRCQGRGLERKTRRLEVEIPPGVEERSRVRMTGEGESGTNGGPSGDLYIFLHIRPHKLFRRRGRDLTSEIEVTFPRAALGGEVEIPTLQGTETLHIPEGTQPGDVFRLRGHGLPELGRPQLKGDQHVVIKVRTPTNLSERQRQALLEFAEAGGEDLKQTAPPPQQEKGFFERIRNLFTGRDDDDKEREQ